MSDPKTETPPVVPPSVERIVRCPDCGAGLQLYSTEHEMAENESWFECEDGCGFTCDAKWSEEAETLVPVSPNPTGERTGGTP